MPCERNLNLVAACAAAVLSLAAAVNVLAQQAVPASAPNPGTSWPATDALSRSMPHPTEVRPPRPDRFVGIFYFLTQGRNISTWKSVAKVPLVAKGNELMLAVPRKTLGLPDSDAVSFDFKWWDNAQKPGDIMDTYLSGDVAPDARFNYRYSTAARSSR